MRIVYTNVSELIINSYEVNKLKSGNELLKCQKLLRTVNISQSVEFLTENRTLFNKYVTKIAKCVQNVKNIVVSLKIIIEF